MKKSLLDFCLQQGQEVLLAQWDDESNSPLTPGAIPYGSTKVVWWQCQNGHRWQAMVNRRTASHTGCPYCAGKLPWPGENDLASQYPALIREWHPTKNLPLQPASLLPGSERKVWWRCSQGHEWQARVRVRVNGCGCPVCANRTVVAGTNDLASCFPALAEEWHPTKNGTCTPRDVTFGTKRRVWWQCSLGHEWQASVQSRTLGGTGCPVCTGRIVQPGENDLASQFPELAAQWHPTRNGALLPTQVARSTKRRVWWLCPQGHAYQASVGMRTLRNSGCPYCAGKKVLEGFNDLATTAPQVAAEWHETLNGTLTPQMVTAGSHKKVWWQCAEGHIWKTAVYSRTGKQQHGCPVCAGGVTGKRQKRYEKMLSEAMEAIGV